MINFIIYLILRGLLAFRYRIRVTGLAEVAARGTRGILFLPNHPALIDPIIVGTILHRRFAPIFIADQDRIDRPVIRSIVKRIRVRTIPDLGKYGAAGRKQIRQVLTESADGLRQGENLLMYPAGHAYRQWLEDLRGNSGVETIMRQAPEVRVVLIRTRGLWGSGFSWASGRAPDVAGTVKRGALALLASGIFFAPRREVTIELVEPEDLPRDVDRETLNLYLENFYNAGAYHNTYVPYLIWEHGGTRELPEPLHPKLERDLAGVPPTTRAIVIEHLRELTGVSDIHDEGHLARDLGMDSLARVEILLWLEQEFGFPAGDVEAIQSVGDVLRAASGETVSAGPQTLKPIPQAWFAKRREPPELPEGETIAEVFLRRAERDPDRIILADQTAGTKTYRDLITAILTLKPSIEALPGENIGIMLPASVTASLIYLATLFAGKVPVMVNWTVGPRQIVHSLNLAGVQRILTSELLVSRLAGQGIALTEVAPQFLFLESMAKEISLARKLGAAFQGRLNWGKLRRARTAGTAVILFTSGSETLPKAVPLTHVNILRNLRDVLTIVRLRADDRLIGILPPFHSFGLGETTLLPLLIGLPTVYHFNPTEGALLVRLIEAYRATILMGTPTFLNGVVRAAAPGQLSSLRLTVTGAEKCSDRIYEALARQCPQTIVLEGYGITECSPIVSANSDRDPRPGTIGRILPSLCYAIVDIKSGRRVENGRPGVLLVRGPSVFGGYLHYVGESPFVEFEGERWYRTGDLVSEGADGILIFRGRLKRFVKFGGEMVSLPAIEAVLEQYYTSDMDKGPVLAVEATSDRDQPEIILFSRLELEREAVNRQIREAGLSPLHNIRQIIRLEEIPTLGTGKTDYRALKEMLILNS
jgi:long-chain-fatty-acid--[acyl-carrier-protein] ligase